MTKVFNPGEILTAADVNAYLVNTTGTGNAIINGAFDIWQRGTSITQVGTTDIYSSDRWLLDVGGDAAASLTCSRQSFSSGEIEAASFGGAEFFARLTQNIIGSATRFNLKQRIENVRTFANQSVNLSFWAKANNAFTLGTNLSQNFGSGGSATVDNTGPNFSVTTSWQRFSGTINIASMSGKTIGASSFLELIFTFPPDTVNDTFDIWGVQVEAGTVATPFRRNANSLQGELAACQRYYYRVGGDQVYQPIAMGNTGNSTTAVEFNVPVPVTMRTAPTSLEFSTLAAFDQTNIFSLSNGILSSTGQGKTASRVSFTATGLTIFRPYMLFTNNSTNGFLGLSAEL